MEFDYKNSSQTNATKFGEQAILIMRNRLINALQKGNVLTFATYCSMSL